MHIASVAAALALAAIATASDPQLPLSDHVPSYRDALLALHRSLISIPSISGTENQVGSFLVDYLASQDYTVDLQFVKPRDNTPEGQDRFNVVAWKGSETPSPRLLVTSHIDVVPPNIPYNIDDGDITSDTLIKGRGSVDAKGSIAAMITAFEELLQANRVNADDVMLLFVVGEEVSGDGMRAFSESVKTMPHGLRFDAAIFGEPTENKLACGHKGGLFCVLKAKGVPGHSGYPWLGKSANEVTVRALAKLIDTDLGSSEEYGNTTVNIGRFEGGVASNVIAENATVDIMVRVAIGPEKEGSEIARHRILKALDEVDDEAFDLECSPGYGFVDCQCGVDGFDDIVVNYGTDIPFLQGDHVRYLYGPGSILVAHGANENLTVGVLEDAVEGYQKLILHALAKDGPEEL